MASGSSGRHNSGSKGFGFASDDILCSYEDYGNQESSNGIQLDPSIGTNPSKDFQKNRISRASVFPATNVNNQPEEPLHQEMILTVERTMKKYADNLMRFLEGISSRLSQLELYCYNLDKSIGEMRSDLDCNYGEADSKLKSLEKHLQEVHRSVLILRDKQELTESQKELAKLQLAQKDSLAASQERTAVSAAESKKTNDAFDPPSTQLALALPSQVAPQSSHASMQQQAVAPQPLPPSQNLSQVPPYYLPSTQLPNPQSKAQPSYISADAQYRSPQLGPQGPQQSQTQVNQTPQTQQFPQYQQQWPQQANHPAPQPQPQPQPPPMQSQNQVRAPTLQSIVYPPYVGAQPANPPPPEPMARSMPMQVPFSGIPQQGVSRADTMAYGYGGAGRPFQPQPSPQHLKVGFPSQPGDGYTTGGSPPPMTSGGTYMLYDNEGARPHLSPQPSHYSQGAYPPANATLPTPLPTNNALMIRSPSPQFLRNHPYNELSW